MSNKSVDEIYALGISEKELEQFRRFDMYNTAGVIDDWLRDAEKYQNFTAEKLFHFIFSVTLEDNRDENFFRDTFDFIIAKKLYPKTKEEQAKLLITAMQKGKANYLSALLKEGFDPNQKYRNEFPLHYALRCQDPKYLKCLLENGAAISVLNDKNNTVLQQAEEDLKKEKTGSYLHGKLLEIIRILSQKVDEKASVQSTEQNSKMPVTVLGSTVDLARLQGIRQDRLNRIWDYTAKQCNKSIDLERLNQLRGYSEYNRDTIDTWLAGKNELSAEAMLNNLYLHARKTKDQDTHKFLIHVLMEPYRFNDVDADEKAKIKRLSMVKNWFSEDFFKRLSECSDFNKIVIDLWLNMTDKIVNSCYFTVNHLLDLLLYVAEIYDDKKTIELLKENAPYSPDLYSLIHYKLNFEDTQKALVEKYPDAIKKYRDVKLQEMLALGVTEEDLTRLAQANQNYIGERFRDWLMGNGDIAKKSAREFFAMQFSSTIYCPPITEGCVQLFKFIMSKKLYPLDEKTQSTLVCNAVVYILYDFVEMMLEAGFSPNGSNILGSALTNAYNKNSVKLVKLLLKHHAVVSQDLLELVRSDNNTTMLALLDPDYLKGKKEEKHLEHKPKESNENSSSDGSNEEEPIKSKRMKEILAVLTPEQFAQYSRYMEETKVDMQNILLDWLSGAAHVNKFSLDDLFRISLHLAIENENEPFFDFLVKNKIFKAEDCGGKLVAAIKGHNTRFLRELLKYGVDPNSDVRLCYKDENPSNTCLFWAYHCKSIACMKILLEAGAKTNTVHFKTKKTVLEMAREDGRDDVIALIEKVEKERGIVSGNKEKEPSEHNSEKSSRSEKTSEADEDNSKEDSSDQESSSGEEPTALEQCIRGIFSNVAKGTDTYEHISDQWTARGKSTVSDEDMKAMPNFIEEKLNGDNFEVHLKTEDLDIHVRRELQNMLAYTSKLYREYQNDAKGNKKKVLGEKVDAATEFIRKVLSQEELTEASIRKAYNSFEQRDKNRSTGLYRLYARWHDQWYEEKKGKKKTERLVKSTLGTFGNLLYKAVENQVVEVKEEDERLEESGVKLSSGG